MSVWLYNQTNQSQVLTLPAISVCHRGALKPDDTAVSGHLYGVSGTQQHGINTGCLLHFTRVGNTTQAISMSSVLAALGAK